MSRPRRIKNRVDGVVLLDKPLGISSQQAVSRLRHVFSAAKAGHTGTLDPAASGLLPVCLGEATKFSHFLLEADKVYLATLRLGIVTSTGDSEGEILSENSPDTDLDKIQSVLKRFVGSQTQTPPMHSALKHHGVPLYEYARKGVNIEREARPIHIYSVQIVEYQSPLLQLRVHCSKGTYIRVLAEDIGAALGFGASLSALCRTQTGSFLLDHPLVHNIDSFAAMDPPTLQTYLMPVETLLADLPRLDVDETQAQRLLLGQKLRISGPATGLLTRVYGPEAHFLGVVQWEMGGRVVPYRMLAQTVENS